MFSEKSQLLLSAKGHVPKEKKFIDSKSTIVNAYFFQNKKKKQKKKQYRVNRETFSHIHNKAPLSTHDDFIVYNACMRKFIIRMYT